MKFKLILRSPHPEYLTFCNGENLLEKILEKYWIEYETKIEEYPRLHDCELEIVVDNFESCTITDNYWSQWDLIFIKESWFEGKNVREVIHKKSRGIINFLKLILSEGPVALEHIGYDIHREVKEKFSLEKLILFEYLREKELILFEGKCFLEVPVGVRNKYRIDAVYMEEYTSFTHYVYEVEKQLTPLSIGQVLVYKTLYEKEYHRAEPVIICLNAEKQLQDVCEDNGIDVEFVDLKNVRNFTFLKIIKKEKL